MSILRRVLMALAGPVQRFASTLHPQSFSDFYSTQADRGRFGCRGRFQEHVLRDARVGARSTRGDPNDFGT